MKLKIIILFFSGIISISAQDTVTRAISPFNAIEIRNGIWVELISSNEERIEITARGVSLTNVVTEVVDRVLNLSLASRLSSSDNVGVKVFYKELTSVSVHNKSEVSMAGLMKQDTLRVYLRTGSQAYLNLDVKYLETKATDGSLFSAKGYANVQQIEALTLANLSLFDLESDSVAVRATSNALVKIYVLESLIAEAATGATLIYKGTPEKTDFKTSVGGKVEQLPD